MSGSEGGTQKRAAMHLAGCLPYLFSCDPLGRTTYPLAFLASLFAADMRAVSSGQITCPVVVIASTGDPLFPFDYIQRVYERIQAPSKELLVFELNAHLIFNECLEEVLPRLVDKLKHYSLSGPQSTSERRTGESFVTTQPLEKGN
jgi:pimeloyl-ACP methyl ester carboxylesterase